MVHRTVKVFSLIIYLLMIKVLRVNRCKFFSFLIISMEWWQIGVSIVHLILFAGGLMWENGVSL